MFTKKEVVRPPKPAPMWRVETSLDKLLWSIVIDFVDYVWYQREWHPTFKELERRGFPHGTPIEEVNDYSDKWGEWFKSYCDLKAQETIRELVCE